MVGKTTTAIKKRAPGKPQKVSQKKGRSSSQAFLVGATTASINDQLAEAYLYGEAVFATMTEAILVLDSHLRIKSANNAFLETFKVTKEKTEGKLVYELGNGQWNIPRLRELLEDILQKSSWFKGFDVHHTFPGIGEKYMRLNARKIMAHDKELIFLAIDDISEQTQAQKIIAEQKVWFREMAENAPALIWMAGSDGSRTFFNKTWLEYTGRKMEEHLGMGWIEAVNKIDFERFMKTYNAAFKEQKPFNIEYRLRRHDEEFRWILSKGQPTFKDGVFTGFIGTCYEIHDQYTLKQELEREVRERTYELEDANKELERSNSELKQFAYVASHDLKEPLRKIQTFSDRLQELPNETLTKKSKDYLNKINSAAKRMSQLIEDLLNFSQAIHHSKEFEQVNLDEVVQNVLKDFDERIEQENTKVEIAKLPTIDGVGIQMRQLFHNLISNALKFKKEGSHTEISISAKTLSPERLSKFRELPKDVEYTEIIVKDNGIGFNNQYAEKIFEIFQRLNEREQYGGTGIGLALCRKIAGYHNGIIFAKSTEGEGASFHIILPVHQK